MSAQRVIAYFYDSSKRFGIFCWYILVPIKVHEIALYITTLSSQVRFNKMLNSLDYHHCPSSSHHSINSLGLYLCRQNGCWIFSQNFIFHHVGKSLKFLEFTLLENAMIQVIVTHVSSHSKLAPKFFSSHPREKEITHSPRQHSFENPFPLAEERGGGTYELLYQNSVRKYEDDLKH